jgi:fucose permease
MALSAQATSADNRGPGLGVFYTWYYVGMAICPALAGTTRDITGSAAAPVLFAGALMLLTLLLVLFFRFIQRQWPIESQAAAT